MKIDLNCDMGEGCSSDEDLMPYISSANIACGYHAGDAETMKRTVALASRYGVAIGAHPAYPDRENFGRAAMELPSGEIYSLVRDQVSSLKEIAVSAGQQLTHVKPHGALYNQSAKDARVASAIAQAVADLDDSLVLVGLSGSLSLSAASAVGLRTAAEAFADRTYQPDGSLTPRTKPDALISSPDESVAQVMQMIATGTVTAVSGEAVNIKPETVCIHGDGPDAVAIATALHDALLSRGITIGALSGR